MSGSLDEVFDKEDDDDSEEREEIAARQQDGPQGSLDQIVHPPGQARSKRGETHSTVRPQKKLTSFRPVLTSLTEKRPKGTRSKSGGTISDLPDR